jgi:diguanylate cyclase (GGDEF)-like protein
MSTKIPSPDPDDREAVKVAREDAREAHAEVTKLQHQVAEAEDRVIRTTAALREANEQLVVSSLQAHTEVETCAKALEQASRAAEHDVLTELPNRALLRDRLSQAIAHAKRDGSLLALLFLDLDNFKEINDGFGHATGDQVLKQAARSLVSAVREGDTVSRHGGDEFLILLSGVSKPSDAALVARKVAAALAGAAAGEEGDVPRLTASIGISVYPGDADDVDTLIACADAAMYLAKKVGPGGFAFHGQQPQKEPIESFVAALRR